MEQRVGRSRVVQLSVEESFGEVSLAGEIRPVSHSSIRQRESAKLGFGRAIGPAGGTNAEQTAKGIQFTGLTMLPNLVDRILTDA